MKNLCTGDWHICASTPIRRTDAYHDVQFDKIKYLYNYALDHGIDTMTVPGDIFDTSKTPYWVVYKYINLFKLDPMWTRPLIFVVLGQHDQVYHTSGFANTPLGLLAAALPMMTILGPEPVNVDGVSFYGAPWGAEVPAVRDAKAVNVLVTHRMIVKRKLWDGQQECAFDADFLEDHPEFNLIVSGDNHTHFIAQRQRNRLINCGSLMRMTAAQMDHTPYFYVWDSETMGVERGEVPHKPSDEVFDAAAIAKEKENEQEMAAFVDTVSDDDDFGMDFRENLRVALKEESDLDVIDHINNLLKKKEAA